MNVGVEAPQPADRLSARTSGITAFASTFAGFLVLAVHGIGARGLIGAFTAVVLVVLSAVDLDRRLIPNRIVLPATAIVLALQLVFFSDDWAEWLGAAAGAALLFGVAHLVRPAGLGLGDVKLAGLLGAALGLDVVPALFLGCIAAALYGLVLVARRGSSARKQTFPLGPFLAAGAILELLLG